MGAPRSRSPHAQMLNHLSPSSKRPLRPFRTRQSPIRKPIAIRPRSRILRWQRICFTFLSHVTCVTSCRGGFFQNADTRVHPIWWKWDTGIFYTLCKFDPNSFEGSTWINDFLQSSFDFVWPRCWNWGVSMLWQLTKVFFCAHYGLQSLRCSSYFHKRAKNDLCQITCTTVPRLPSVVIWQVIFLECSFSAEVNSASRETTWVPYERCLREGRSVRDDSGK